MKALIVMLAASMAFAQTPQPAFTITIGTAQAAVTAKSPIEVQVILKNTSNHEIRVFVDNSGKAELSGFGAEVTDSQGLVPKITAYYNRLTREEAPREKVMNPDASFVIVTSGGSLPIARQNFMWTSAICMT
jgi:hypothetical protein